MKRPLIFLSAVLLGASLQGCGGGDEKQAAAPALPADSCTGHELEVALPPAGKPLFGYDFLSRQCGYNDATVVFGAADGRKRLEIVLTDTGLPAPPTEGDAVSYRAAQDKLREMTLLNARALFSTKALTKDERMRMESFRADVLNLLKTHTNWPRKLRLKWLDCLY